MLHVFSVWAATFAASVCTTTTRAAAYTAYHIGEVRSDREGLHQRRLVGANHTRTAYVLTTPTSCAGAIRASPDAAEWVAISFEAIKGGQQFSHGGKRRVPHPRIGASVRESRERCHHARWRHFSRDKIRGSQGVCVCDCVCGNDLPACVGNREARQLCVGTQARKRRLFEDPTSDPMPSTGGATHPRSRPLVHVAPMQCYTNRHLRRLLRLLSTDAILWTEMEKVDDILANPHRHLATVHTEHPLVLQLGGDDVHKVHAATTAARQRGGFQEVNLNCGCPSVSTGGAEYGATLMRRARHTRELIDAIGDAAAGEMDVSVKCRIGVHESLTADGRVPPDSYEELARFVDAVSADGGASHVVVHARSAILGGLSCLQNRRIPPLRYDYVRRIASEFDGLRVTLNGGLELGGEWARDPAWLGEGIDGVMVGRSILRRPLDLWHVDGRREEGIGGVHARLSRASAIDRYARASSAEVDGPLSQRLAPLLLVAQQLQEEEKCAEDEEGGGEEIAAGTMDADERREVFAAVWEGAATLLMEERRAGKAVVPASTVLADADDAGARLPVGALVKMISGGLGKKEAKKLVKNRQEALT